MIALPTHRLKARYQTWQLNASPWKQTVVESLLFTLLSYLLIFLLLGLHLGGLLRNDPNFFSAIAKGHFAAWVWTTLWSAAIFTPILEEYIFRGVPLALMRRANLERSSWMFGVVSALVFAFAHRSVGGVHFAFPQFFFGLMAWRLASLRGLRHSMVLHFTLNFSIILFLTLFYLSAGFR